MHLHPHNGKGYSIKNLVAFSGSLEDDKLLGKSHTEVELNEELFTNYMGSTAPFGTRFSRLAPVGAVLLASCSAMAVSDQRALAGLPCSHDHGYRVCGHHRVQMRLGEPFEVGRSIVP